MKSRAAALQEQEVASQVHRSDCHRAAARAGATGERKGSHGEPQADGVHASF